MHLAANEPIPLLTETTAEGLKAYMLMEIHGWPGRDTMKESAIDIKAVGEDGDWTATIDGLEPWEVANVVGYVRGLFKLEKPPEGD